MPHPLVTQLYFARSEFQRALEGLSEDDARKRILPMNCISWNVGHLAWQEQRYFLNFAQGKIPIPRLNEEFPNGGPASTPSLAEMQEIWKSITTAATAWPETVTPEQLLLVHHDPSGWSPTFGNLLQRVIYHYWYHTGENMAIRQSLQNQGLQDFIGNLDDEAPYRPA